MRVLSLLWGILAIVGMVVGFFSLSRLAKLAQYPFCRLGRHRLRHRAGYGGQQLQELRYRGLSMLHCGAVFWHHTPCARRRHFLTTAGHVFTSEQGLTFFRDASTWRLRMFAALSICFKPQ